MNRSAQIIIITTIQSDREVVLGVGERGIAGCRCGAGASPCLVRDDPPGEQVFQNIVLSFFVVGSVFVWLCYYTQQQLYSLFNNSKLYFCSSRSITRYTSICVDSERLKLWREFNSTTFHIMEQSHQN